MTAPAAAAYVGPAATDVEAARSLARQKARATALVALCGLAYACAKAFESRHPAVPYVAAFAEAAIIGVLADWYAVVALFRHPLGLPLPHTAIIPANQSRIAEAIGDFVAKHFLAGSRVQEKVLELDPAASAGRWLAVPANRQGIVARAAFLLPEAVQAIDREMLRGEIERRQHRQGSAVHPNERCAGRRVARAGDLYRDPLGDALRRKAHDECRSGSRDRGR